MKRPIGLAFVLFLAAGAHAAASAQVCADSTASRATLFTGRDLLMAGGVAAVTAALVPFDARIGDRLREPVARHSGVVHTGAQVFNYLGEPGAAVAAVGAYVVGRVAGSSHLADLGLHTAESIAMSGATAWVLKGSVGRRRPFVDQTDPDDFTPGKGFTRDAWSSLPSGHTTVAFAAASAITAETRHWWPGAPWVVGPLLYGGAGLVGLARIYDTQHWPSDVVLAAGIGTLSGLKVVGFNHKHPCNRIDRWLRAVTVVPSGHGVVLALRVGAR